MKSLTPSVFRQCFKFNSFNCLCDQLKLYFIVYKKFNLNFKLIKKILFSSNFPLSTSSQRLFRSALSHENSQSIRNNNIKSSKSADDYFLAFNDLNEAKNENFDHLPPLMTFQTNVGINLTSTKKTELIPTHSNACVLNANFFQPEQFIFYNEEQSKDLLNASNQDLSLDEVVYEKLPRWRRIYERTGRLNQVFQSKATMKIKLNDIHRMGVNFVDSSKTRVNLTDPVNLFLFGNLLKSKAVTCASNNKTPINKSKGSTEKPAEPAHLGPKRLKIMIGPECLVDRKESNMHESKLKPTNKLLVATNSSKSQSNNTNKQAKSAATPLPHISTTNTQKLSNNVKPKTPAVLNKTKSNTLMVEAAKSNQTLTVNTKLSKKSTSTVGVDLVKGIKQENTNSLDNSQNAESVSSCLLSSEMTSLEKRLLGIDKAKTALTRPKTVSESSSQNTTKSVTAAVNVEKVSNTSLSRIKQELAASKPVKASAPVAPLPVIVNKPHDIKEELKKVVAKYRRPRVEDDALNSLKKQETPLAELVVMKRKKCFWDPDSDTEYDRLINKKQNLAAKKQRIKGLKHILLF